VTDHYDRVRRQLVEHGYLQGRIERFVLRDLLRSPGVGGLALSSLKAALVGAPLMGALLAASTIAANRPLLGARDALVLWGYFALPAGVALFALDCVAAAAAAAWARRRGVRASDSLRAGLIVAAPVLAYLAAVWAVGRPERGWGGDTLFLLGAVGVTALVAWLAGIVSLAGIVGVTGVVPDRNRRAAAVVIAVLVPIAAGFLLIPAAISSPRGATAPSPFVPGAAPVHVLVIGIDGLDGALVEALAGTGAVDHLLAAVARGAMYPKHRADGLEPPEVWTTIATGMPVEAHGVRAAGASRLPGVAAPITPHAGPAALDASCRRPAPGGACARSGRSPGSCGRRRRSDGGPRGPRAASRAIRGAGTSSPIARSRSSSPAAATIAIRRPNRSSAGWLPIFPRTARRGAGRSHSASPPCPTTSVSWRGSRS
jgi:hypothetical protein